MMRVRAARARPRRFGIRIDQGEPMSPNSPTALPVFAACEGIATRLA
jgi:hypothetical protein